MREKYRVPTRFTSSVLVDGFYNFLSPQHVVSENFVGVGREGEDERS